MSWYWVCVLALLGVGACRAETPTGAEDETWGLQQLLRRLDLQDATVSLPGDARATLSTTDLAQGVLNFKLQLPDAEAETGLDGEGRGKKKKIKKILIPIAVLLFMKALALIPLILGVLGIKTWNALQLAFITFVTSFGLAIFELCKKFAADHPPPIVAHEHWDAHHRSFNVDQVAEAQQMAYSGYVA